MIDFSTALAITSIPVFAFGSIIAANDSRIAEHYGALCDSGSAHHCRELAKLTGGNCASPGATYGCKFDSLN
jgi:hypothetical protein